MNANEIAGNSEYELPESVKSISLFILNLDILSTRKGLVRYRTTEECGREKAMALFVLEEMLKRNESWLLDFIKRAYIVEGLVNENNHVMFYHDGWYLSPFGTHKKKLYISPFSSKNNHALRDVFSKESVLSILVKQYGIRSEEVLGIDFTRRKWVDILLKDNTKYAIYIWFLESLISGIRQDEFLVKHYERFITDNEKVDFFTLFIAHYLMGEMMYLDYIVDVFKDEDELNESIYLVTGHISGGKKVHWMEFGEFYLGANDTKENGFEILKLSDLSLERTQKFNLKQALKTNESYKEWLRSVS